MTKLLSHTEISYTEAGCDNEIRQDGRGLTDSRFMHIENNVLPHVNGSSHVSMSDGTDVICSIKLDVVEPETNFPDKGLVTVSVNFSPSCNLKLDDKRLQEMSNRVGELYYRLVHLNEFELI